MWVRVMSAPVKIIDSLTVTSGLRGHCGVSLSEHIHSTWAAGFDLRLRDTYWGMVKVQTYNLLTFCFFFHYPGGLHQTPLLSKQGQKPSSPVQPNLSPEKGSPTKSPPHPPKGFNPNAPTFVPMGLQNVPRPANVSVCLPEGERSSGLLLGWGPSFKYTERKLANIQY